MTRIGIDDIAFYTSNFYLDLHILAEKRNTDHDKYASGIGIEKIGIPAPDEDIITMGANAAIQILEQCDRQKIDTLLFATESSVDQSKSAAVFVHRLLDLPSECRTVELKQACYSSTAAVQIACALVARNPEKSVLVISSDIARYDLESAGEATQGCGAVAMLIKADPRILSIEPGSGCYSADTWDFWRPNYCSNPKVDGKFSIINYIRTAKECWKNLAKNTGVDFNSIYRFCYHLPFSTMGLKAHIKLGKEMSAGKTQQELEAQVLPSTVCCRQIGNCYSASAYIALCSLLDNEQDLAGKNVAIFGYGSGCAGEFYYGVVSDSYQKMLRTDHNKKLLSAREAIDFSTYLEFYQASDTKKYQDGNYTTPAVTPGMFRFSGIRNHARMYDRCADDL